MVRNFIILRSRIAAWAMAQVVFEQYQSTTDEEQVFEDEAVQFAELRHEA